MSPSDLRIHLRQLGYAEQEDGYFLPLYLDKKHSYPLHRSSRQWVALYIVSDGSCYCETFGDSNGRFISEEVAVKIAIKVMKTCKSEEGLAMIGLRALEPGTKKSKGW